MLVEYYLEKEFSFVLFEFLELYRESIQSRFF